MEELIKQINAPVQGICLSDKELRNLQLKDITLLKAAHHGSRYSTGENFLRELAPRIVFLSCGRNNRYGHPHEELLDRLKEQGCTIYQTRESGAVTLHVKGKKAWIDTFLK